MINGVKFVYSIPYGIRTVNVIIIHKTGLSLTHVKY